MCKLLKLMTKLNFRHVNTIDGGKGYNPDGVIRTYHRIDDDFKYHIAVSFDNDEHIINAKLSYSINTINNTATESIEYDDVIYFLNDRFKFELRKNKISKLLNE